MESALESPRKELKVEASPLGGFWGFLVEAAESGGGGGAGSEAALKAGGGSSLPRSPQVAHASHYHK